MNIDTGMLSDLAKLSDEELAALRGSIRVPSSLESEAVRVLAGQKQVRVTKKNSPSLDAWAKLTKKQRKARKIKTWKDFCN